MRSPVCQRDFRDDDLRRHGCVLASLAWVRQWAGNDRATEDRVDDYLLESGVSRADFRRRGVMLGEAASAMSGPYPGDRLPPVYRKVVGGSVERDLFPDIAAGAVALVWVDYGVVQDDGLGIGTFRGGHGVVYATVGDDVVVIDPLRRQTTRWSRELAVKAAERFGSRRRVNALLVRPSLTHVQEIARYRDLMLRARSQRDEAKAEVERLKALADGTALERLRSVCKTVAGNLEEQVDILDKAVA